MNPGQPSLAILFNNGMLQLMRDIHDDNEILIDTELKPTDIQWSHDGTILAIIGRTKNTSPGPHQNAIHLFNPFGNLLRSMKLPGTQVSALAWEAFSSRIAFAIDSYIYLAQVKHDYMWTNFSNTLVYHFTRKNKPESYVMFWDTKNNEVLLPSFVCFSLFYLIILSFLALCEASEAIHWSGFCRRSLCTVNSSGWRGNSK